MPQHQYGVVLSHYNIEQILLAENLMEQICFLFFRNIRRSKVLNNSDFAEKVKTPLTTQ